MRESAARVVYDALLLLAAASSRLAQALYVNKSAGPGVHYLKSFLECQKVDGKNSSICINDVKEVYMILTSAMIIKRSVFEDKYCIYYNLY